MIDADTVLEPDALSRAALPFLEDPATVAVGGNVAITNGCRIEQRPHHRGRACLEAGWHGSRLSSTCGAFSCSGSPARRRNGVTLISGAFGLFRRDAVIASAATTGRRSARTWTSRFACRRSFARRPADSGSRSIPIPLCSTQVPEDWDIAAGAAVPVAPRAAPGAMASSARDRQSTLRRRRHGRAAVHRGLRGAGAAARDAGYAVITVAAACSAFSLEPLSGAARRVALFGDRRDAHGGVPERPRTRRYLRGRDLALLLAVAVLENCGYRQLNSWWGCVGTVQAVTGKGGWGPMTRRAF